MVIVKLLEYSAAQMKFSIEELYVPGYVTTCKREMEKKQKAVEETDFHSIFATCVEMCSGIHMSICSVTLNVIEYVFLSRKV